MRNYHQSQLFQFTGVFANFSIDALLTEFMFSGNGRDGILPATTIFFDSVILKPRYLVPLVLPWVDYLHSIA
jgi:hypothetical protein